MRKAIHTLAQLDENTLFETLSEGLPLIIDNAASFDETAYRLYQAKDFRASKIMSSFAEEEAAKALILIDYVRCPRESGKREQVLRRFNSHVAKGIHAMACNLLIDSFGELSELVESECLPLYLDGPNGVDWIFSNRIRERRERYLYVDYVESVTDEENTYFWAPPYTLYQFPSNYTSPNCVRLAQALSGVGAFSSDGLAEITEVWKDFTPEPDTDRSELCISIRETLNRLEMGGRFIDEGTRQFIVQHWPFPLWSLTMNAPYPNNEDFNALREHRNYEVERIEHTEAKREPEPAISRSKVEAMSGAYAVWERDSGAQGDHFPGLELPSYQRITEMFHELSSEERAALVALGWFAQQKIADWPRIYERAIDETPGLSETYQIARLGNHWLLGLARWEAKPRPFVSGQ